MLAVGVHAFNTSTQEEPGPHSEFQAKWNTLGDLVSKKGRENYRNNMVGS